MIQRRHSRLIQVTDLHFWHVTINPLRLISKRLIGNANVFYKRRHEFVMTLAGTFADYIAGLDIKRVLVTGDLTSTALPKEFDLARSWVDILQQHKLDVTLIPGNHDVYTFRAKRARRFEEYFSDVFPDEGLPSVMRLEGGTPVLLIPSVIPNYISSQGEVKENELGRTRELLEELEGPIIVGCHYPFLNHTYGYKTGRERWLRNAEDLRRVLGESGKQILYICGHVHRFSYVTDLEYPHLHHLTTGAFFRYDRHSGRQGEIGEIHVDAHGFDVFHHTYDGAWRREHVQPRLDNPDEHLRNQ